MDVKNQRREQTITLKTQAVARKVEPLPEKLNDINLKNEINLKCRSMVVVRVLSIWTNSFLATPKQIKVT